VLSEALAATIAQMRSEGRLGPGSEAVVALAEGLAAAVELESDNAALWKEYRAVLATLMAIEGDGDDETQRFLLEVCTPVRNASRSKPANTRSGGRGGGAKAGAGVDAVAADGRGRRPRVAP
jgi:hypothetical protein